VVNGVQNCTIDLNKNTRHQTVGAVFE